MSAAFNQTELRASRYRQSKKTGVVLRVVLTLSSRLITQQGRSLMNGFHPTFVSVNKQKQSDDLILLQTQHEETKWLSDGRTVSSQRCLLCCGVCAFVRVCLGIEDMNNGWVVCAKMPACGFF